MWGWRSFAREAAEIHLIIARGARTTPLPGVRVHESRRIRAEQVVTVDHLPCTGVARSAIDAAAWQPFPRFACAVVSAVVQQGLTSPAELQNELRYVGRVRHKAYLRLALSDIAGGAQSLGELDLAEVCRRFRLVAPNRQVPRRETGGTWRFLDAEWVLPTGEVVVLEVDGGHHRLVEHWEADMRRERAIVVSRRRVLRATTFELRLDAGAIVADLRALGVPTLAELSDSRRAIAS